MPAMVRPAPARNIPAPIHPILAVLVMTNLHHYDSAPGPDVSSAVLLVLFLTTCMVFDVSIEHATQAHEE